MAPDVYTSVACLCFKFRDSKGPVWGANYKNKGQNEDSKNTLSEQIRDKRWTPSGLLEYKKNSLRGQKWRRKDEHGRSSHFEPTETAN